MYILLTLEAIARELMMVGHNDYTWPTTEENALPLFLGELFAEHA